MGLDFSVRCSAVTWVHLKCRKFHHKETKQAIRTTLCVHKTNPNTFNGSALLAYKASLFFPNHVSNYAEMGLKNSQFQGKPKWLPNLIFSQCVKRFYMLKISMTIVIHHLTSYHFHSSLLMHLWCRNWHLSACYTNSLYHCNKVMKWHLLLYCNNLPEAGISFSNILTMELSHRFCTKIWLDKNSS